MSAEGSADATRRVVERAIRRITLMEMVLLAMAGGLSLVGGALAAVGLQAAVGFSFRPTWAVCSLLFFVVPGIAVLGRERRARVANHIRVAEASPKENDG